MNTAPAKFWTRYPRWFLWMLVLTPALVMPLPLSAILLTKLTVREVGPYVVLFLVSSGVIALVGANALRNQRRRPVIEVCRDAVTFGSVFAVQSATARIARADVRRVVESRERWIEVELRSGGRRIIHLKEVPARERPAARRAIEGLFASA